MPMPQILTHRDFYNRVFNVFFIIDTNSRMSGEKIEEINKTMKEIVSFLKNIQKNYSDISLNIDVINFDTYPRSMYGGVLNIEDFEWSYLLADGCLREIGGTFDYLYSRFKNDFVAPYYPSLVVFIINGYPTDDYRSELERLKENKRFIKAHKIAIGIDEYATDISLLQDFTGNEDAIFVIDEDGPEKLSSIMKLITSLFCSCINLAWTNKKSRYDALLKAVHKNIQRQIDDCDFYMKITDPVMHYNVVNDV